ncbi:hypothetical protein [Pontibacter liquoris]|uniref:hypothetical protein n=1 Tax=Pontibacter liquoris TaxID=2905677 RepID=UPI001FA758D7|nr:hypothetical protein [Pontibacter liquoris]
MLLHKDGLIELHYEVASDILTVRWPDLTGASLSEVTYSFKMLTDTLKHYDIKRLLVDSRRNTVEVPEETYLNLMTKFTHELLATRLVKFARLKATDPVREKKTEDATELVNSMIVIPIAFKNFSDEESARRWLRE